jgi:hypothetical protein
MASSDSFDALLRWFDSAIDWSGVAVAVGLIAEYIPDFSKTLEAREWIAKSFLVVGATLVIGGVSGETYFHHQYSKVARRQEAAGRQEQTRLRTLVDSLKVELADANARTKEAGARAAEANEGAAKANAQAAQAELELARMRTPRTLTAEQQKHLISILTPFSGQKFSMSVQGEEEAITFLGTLKSVLVSAGWIPIPSQMGAVQINGAGEIFEDGVIVEVTPKAEMKCADLAALLTNALNAMGVSTRALRDSQLKDDSALNIAVGKKP